MDPMPFASWTAALRERAAQTPAQPLFRFLRERDGAPLQLDCAGLDRRARAIAAALQQRGAPGQRVLLLFPPGLDYVAAFYGCLYAGAIAVPLYPPQRRKLALIEGIAADCGASLVLTTAAVVAKAPAELAAGSALGRLPWLAVDPLEEAAADAWRAPLLGSDAIAYLQYTSGSTSAPKGVIVDHGMALAQCAELAESWGMTPSSVMVSWLPHFHDFGQVAGVLMPVFLGSRSVLLSPASFIQQPLRWLAAIDAERGTHGAAPNFAYDYCVDQIAPAQRAGLDLRSWVTAANGAEPVRWATLQRFHAAFAPCGLRWETLCPGYGLAEATLKVTSVRWDRAPAAGVFDTDALARGRARPAAAAAGRALVSCGAPAAGTALRIVDPATARPLPEGEVGEIWVRSASVSRGYWNRPQESECSFGGRLAGAAQGEQSAGERFLRSGDLGFLRGGELYISGRLKDLIVIRGANHYPQDIELTLEAAHPLLRPGHSAAFAVEHKGEERLVLVAERRRFCDQEYELQDALLALRQAVASAHELDACAAVLVPSGGVPRTSSGKIQRQECRRRFLAGELEVAAEWREMPPAPPRAARAATSAAIGLSAAGLSGLIRAGVCARLGGWLAERPGSERSAADFARPLAAHGVDSVAMLALHHTLEGWLGREVPAEWLWDSPSLEALADQLTGLAASAAFASGAAAH